MSPLARPLILRTLVVFAPSFVDPETILSVGLWWEKGGPMDHLLELRHLMFVEEKRLKFEYKNKFVKHTHLDEKNDLFWH